jgi:hypothetical protein
VNCVLCFGDNKKLKKTGVFIMSAPQMPVVKRRDIINFAKFYWSEKRYFGVAAVVFLGLSVGVDVFILFIADIWLTH